MTHNTSSLRLILASSEPKEMKLNTALAQAEQMINHLATLAKFLVVDLGARFSDLNRKIPSVV